MFKHVCDQFVILLIISLDLSDSRHILRMTVLLTDFIIFLKTLTGHIRNILGVVMNFRSSAALIKYIYKVTQTIFFHMYVLLDYYLN